MGTQATYLYSIYYKEWPLKLLTIIHAFYTNGDNFLWEYSQIKRLIEPQSAVEKKHYYCLFYWSLNQCLKLFLKIRFSWMSCIALIILLSHHILQIASQITTAKYPLHPNYVHVSLRHYLIFKVLLQISFSNT